MMTHGLSADDELRKAIIRDSMSRLGFEEMVEDSSSWTVARARAYLAKMEPAVSGQGGHNQTYKVACKLVEFGLSSNEAWTLLCEYNQRCQPPWSERDLQHKLDDAYRLACPKAQTARPYSRPAPAPAARQKIDNTTAAEIYLKDFRACEVEVREASLTKLPDDWRQHARVLVEALYQPGERINIVIAYSVKYSVNKDGKAEPYGCGVTLSREEWLAHWRKCMPSVRAGGWLRMNPVDGQGVADANVTAFRYALLEFDDMPLDLQLSLFAKLPLPIAAIMTSGGRSLHAWVRMDATSVEDYRKQVAEMLRVLAKFGTDEKNKNPSRLSRLPGVTRTIGADGDGRQRLLYLDPNPSQRRILNEC